MTHDTVNGKNPTGIDFSIYSDLVTGVCIFHLEETGKRKYADNLRKIRWYHNSSLRSKDLTAQENRYARKKYNH